LCIDEIELIIGHTRCECAVPSVARNQPDLHRSDVVTDDDSADDGTLREVPNPDTPTPVWHTSADMERGNWTYIVTGDHEVMRFVNRDAVRIKRMLCVVGGGWQRLHDVEVYIIFHHTPWMRATRATHKRREKPPSAERGKLVGDGGVRRIVRANELRMAWLCDIKEEDLSLTPQKAEQATEGQRPSVAGEADMVRLQRTSTGVMMRAPVASPSHHVSHRVLRSLQAAYPARVRLLTPIVALTVVLSTATMTVNLSTPSASQKALRPPAKRLTR
jgi:hypothetical protein